MLTKSKCVIAPIAALAISVFLVSGAPGDKNAATNTAVAAAAVTAQSAGCAANLKDGSVLITGGHGASGTSNGAQVFSARKGAQPVAPMLSAREGHACAALPDGRVLVAGGKTTGGGVTNSAEIFDPVSSRWSAAGNMAVARSGAAGVSIAGGRILIAGGASNGAPTSSLEVFDPAANSFHALPALLTSPRMQHATVALPNGKVLIAGGSNGAASLDSIDVFDTTTNMVAPLGRKLSSPRAGLSATVLLDGRVYFAGGNDGKQDLNSADLYTPKTGALTPAAPMSVARSGHLAILVPNNNTVLIVGGNARGGLVLSQESYVPWWNVYRPFGAPGHSGNSAGPMAAVAAARAHAADVTTPAAGDAPALPTLYTDKPDYLPGQVATITGFGWPANADVNLTLTRVPQTSADTTWTATTDANGFLSTTYNVVTTDLGVTFTLTAASGSDATAQIQTISFTDGNPTPATYASDCTTPKTTFVGGDTVCAVITGMGSDDVILQVLDSSSAVFNTSPLLTKNGKAEYSFPLTPQPVPAGTWTINLIDEKDSKQNTSVTFTVGGTAPTITSANNTTFTYGSAGSFAVTTTGSPTPSLSESGALPGGVTFIDNGNGTATLAGTPQAAGSFLITITANNGVAPNATQNFTLTVNPAPLMVTADNKIKTYGDANPALTFTAATFLNGDTFSTAPTCLTTAAQFSPVSGSPYAITCSGGVAANYSISYTPGTLTVSPALLMVTAGNQTKTYGDANPPLTFNAATFLNGDTFSTAPTCSTTATQFSAVSGSPYAITCSGAVAANYSISYTPGTLTVNPAALMVTADNKTKTYGDANPARTFNAATFMNGDAFSTAPTCLTTATQFSAVSGSPYAITCSGGVAANYSISYAPGNLTVTKLTLNGSADSKSRLYNAGDPAFTVTFTGFLGSDTQSSTFTGIPSCSAGDTLTTPVGSYTLTCGAGSLTAANYAVGAISSGTLAITKAPLTITANNQTRPYGDGNPAFSYTPSPTPVPDSSGGTLTGVTCSTTATSTSAVGPYPITCSGGADPDYAISYQPGTLTITLRPTAIAYTGPTSSVYGDCIVNVSAVLRDLETSTGINGQLITIAIGTQSVTATTDANGLASGFISLNQNAGTISANASYAGSPIYGWSTSGLSNNFSINVDPSVGALTGQTVYTGSQVFWTANSTSKTATLTLAATVQDTGRIGTGGTCHGDIRTAKLTFAYRAQGTTTWTPIPSAQNLSVGLIDPTNPTTGTASAITQFNLGNANFAQFEVAVILAGNYYYNNPADDAIVTVGVPGVANTIIAGGDIDLHANSTYPASSGYLAIPAGLQAGKEGYLNISGTVSFTGKNTKTLTNPQGSIWLKLSSFNKPDGTLDSTPHSYFIKTNSIASLSQPVSGTFSFTAKASVQDVTTGTSLDGGATVQLTVNDDANTVAVSVQSSKTGGNMWITSAWNGTTTVAKPVQAGGSITGN